ncbi:MAG: hypothetical protein EG828_14700 [Deltaproteobacteria bacterium]|nr:hypothetical protein [Deltaproteobacteria bacterium]
MLKDMKTHCHLKPGQKGTRRLVEQYGKSLLCVRYRYDQDRGIRLKTVEIIVEEKPWSPQFRFRDGDMVPVAVGFGETELREKLRKARAKWDPQSKLWLVPYRLIRGTELEARIPEEFLNGSKKL